jgi:hypothetical protein
MEESDSGIWFVSLVGSASRFYITSYEQHTKYRNECEGRFQSILAANSSPFVLVTLRKRKTCQKNIYKNRNQ